MPLVRAFLASLLISLSVGAGSWVVQTLSGSGTNSLPDVITQANQNGGGSITFAVSGTINLGASLPQIGADIDIIGPGAGSITVDGGGQYQMLVVAAGSTLSVSGMTFSHGHEAPTTFGQVLSVSGSAVVVDCIFQGAGPVILQPETSMIYSTGTLSISSCWISNGNMQITTVRIAGGTATFQSSTFSGNAGSGSGVVYVQGSTSFLGCTFAGNSRTATLTVAAPTTVEGCTIIDNAVDTGSGWSTIYALSGSATSLQNSIVIGTTGGNDILVRAGTFTDLGHNVIGTYSGMTPDPSDQVGIARSAAGIGTLADNGGPTQTCALQVGSPLIDAGSYQSSLGNFDQRGSPHARVSGPAMDIGAFELQQSGSGGGDPVFRGFRGQRFSFSGRRDRVFHIFSDASICINALFGAARPDLAKRSHGTVMAALSIRLALPARADPEENKPPPTNSNRNRSRSRSASAEWIAVARAEQRGQVELNTTAAEQLADDDDECAPQLHWSDNATRLEFVLPGRGNISFVWRSMATRHVNTTFLDIRIDEASFAPAAAMEPAQRRSATPGGLLGITARSKSMPEKAELDQRLYLTSHLLAVDALSCKYKAQPLPCI